MARAALVTSYGHGSPDNVFGCGNSTGYDDGRSGTRVATATSLGSSKATALVMAMVAPATRLASVARWDQQSEPSPDLSQLFDGTRRCRGLNFAPCLAVR